MKCNEILKYISDYIDGALSPKLNKQIETHLNECFSCRAIADTLKFALGLCQELEVIQTPVSVHESLHKMLKQEWDLLRVPISLEQPRIMATEIVGKGNKMIIRIEVPGIKKSDINITGSADAIEIIAFRERPEGTYYLNELIYGKLEKRFDLPLTIDVSKIKIKVIDGMLEITTIVKK
ncbi:MAG: Hsp20 family protein [bacterium]|nr:Hsp20 family protein [bacterium]